jgi:hypothetical protein
VSHQKQRAMLARRRTAQTSFEKPVEERFFWME